MEPSEGDIGRDSSQKLDFQGKTLLKQAYLWHKRLGHISIKLLKLSAKNTEGLPDFSSLKETDLKCLPCLQANMRRIGHQSTGKEPAKTFDIISGDTFAIKPAPLLQSQRIGLMLVDRKSRFKWVKLLPSRNDDVILGAISEVLEWVKNIRGSYPLRFHYDGELETNAATAYFRAKGIHFTISSPRTPEQNGQAERSIGVFVSRLRALMYDMDIPKYLWNYLVEPLVDILNRCSSTVNTESSFQQIWDEYRPETAPNKPDLKGLKVLGSKCLVHIPVEDRQAARKLDIRSHKGLFLGLISTNTYRVWVPSLRKVVKSAHVRFFEADIPIEKQFWGTKGDNLGAEDTVSPEFQKDTVSEGEQRGLADVTPVITISDPNEPPMPQLEDEPKPSKIEVLLPERIPNENDYEDYRDLDSMDIDCATSYAASYTSKTEISHWVYSIILETKNRVLDEEPKRNISAAPISSKGDCYSTIVPEPRTVRQALASPEAKKWKSAITAELSQIVTRNTFKCISRKRLLKRPISSRWVFTRKRDIEGNVSKYKARLVIRGFEQVEGIDYFETFAATSTPPTWRILLALAAALDWEIEQIDFVGAFLNADLKEEIVIAMPDGLAVFLAENPELAKAIGYDPAESQAIRVLRSLYGLKQAPREWQLKVQKLLKKLGFSQLKSDPAVYYNAARLTFVVSHVDDCLIIGPSKQYIKLLKQDIAKVYEIQDLGPASIFLGVQIVRNRPKRTLQLHQQQYITVAAEAFELNGLNPIYTPLPYNATKNKVDSATLDASLQHLYLRLIGTSMYALVQTRPDIAFSVQWLSRQNQKPTSGHLRYAKHLIRYLDTASSLAITYTKNFSLEPIVYSDSDWAGCPETGKSTWGYLVLVAGAAVSWKCKRSTIVALSSSEAEYIALTEATREVNWIKGLFSEIQRPLSVPTPLVSDNQTAITLANNPKHHNRTKHQLIRFSYVREAILNKVVSLQWVRTDKQPADGLTKVLSRALHLKFQDMLGLHMLQSQS